MASTKSQAIIREISKEVYQSENGYTARRENGLSPRGNPLGDKWVLRNASGDFVDFDKYRHDLFERNDLRT